MVENRKNRRPDPVSVFLRRRLRLQRIGLLVRWFAGKDRPRDLADEQHQVNMLKGTPFLHGTCPWILMDFRSPRRPLPGIQDFYNRKGLISNKGEKKKAFYVMQRFYRELGQGRR